MQRKVVGLPLSEAMESPVVVEWMQIIPWMKSAFIDGRIVGVMFLDRVKIINVSDRMNQSEINELTVELGVLVGIEA